MFPSTRGRPARMAHATKVNLVDASEQALLRASAQKPIRVIAEDNHQLYSSDENTGLPEDVRRHERTLPHNTIEMIRKYMPRREHIFLVCVVLAASSFLAQLRTTARCSPQSLSRDARRSVDGLPQRRCGNHKPSTTFLNSYNVTPVILGGRSGNEFYVGPDLCESRCESDAVCKGWTYHSISERLGYCSRFKTLEQGHPNSKFTSGVCGKVKDVRATASLPAQSFGSLGYTADAASTHPEGARHVCMIFDEARFDYALGYVKSMEHFGAGNTIVYHLVVPESLVRRLQASVHLARSHVYFYDFTLCKELIRPVRPFAPHLHDAPMCKVFLADLLPDTIDQVLFVDNDCVAVSDSTACFPMLGQDELLGMVVDHGEVCQADPDTCWPMPFEWTVTEGLVCGTSPTRAERLKSTGRAKKCSMAGDKEPVQFNAGIILFNLKRMREIQFTEELVNITWQTARMAGQNKIANWGDQEFLNNYFRFNPAALHVLPCGCNYQWTAARRAIKCPGQPVYIGHGWHAGTEVPTKDPYNKLFFHFKLCDTNCDTPPMSDWMLRSGKEKMSPEYPIKLIHTTSCPHQAMACNEDLSAPIFNKDTIYVLTRTAARPNFFREARMSVLRQTHKYIEHLVLTDDPSSMSYIEGDQVLEVPTKYHTFDAMEPCEKCGASPDRGCGNAPYEPESRARFLDCYCSTSYPMNTYMDDLHSQVETGWVVYLDDDNMFLDDNGLASALVHAHSHSDLVLWRAKLGRIVPKDVNFGASKIVRGDSDSSNFMFHSDNLASTRWGDTRCGDYRTISSLANLLHMRWLNRVVIAANPMRQALGGLGLRGEFNSKVTVIVTSCTTEGFRPFWLKRTMSQYLSEPYSTVVHRVILVWNAPDLEPPPLPEKVVVLRMKKNSLNNRWTKILEHVRTEAILNLDDDVFVTKSGIICLMNWWSLHQDRLVGPFVRKNDGFKYVIDELFGHKYYTLMLPRVMVISRTHLMTYRMVKPEIREYVDTQSAHCDDIVMNVAVAHKTKKAPFRVLLPPSSIIDYYSTCWKDFKQDTAGLGLQDKRAHHRSICMEWILNRFEEDVLQASSDVGACDALGARLRPEFSNSDNPDAWRNMTQKPDTMLCAKQELQQLG